MGSLIPFTPPGEVNRVAERLAQACRLRLLERPDRPAPLAALIEGLGEDPGLANLALEQLRRSGRIGIGRFPQRHRPHALVLGISRIDDVGVGR